MIGLSKSFAYRAKFSSAMYTAVIILPVSSFSWLEYQEMRPLLWESSTKPG